MLTALLLAFATPGDPRGGTFRSILHFVPHRAMHGARYGLRRNSNNTVITVDKPGNWHSQAGQDRTIALLTGGQRQGFFVDLAANDPITLSNTRSLERDYGWNGICIDGNDGMLNKLVAQRTCTVVKGIVSSVSGATVEFTAPTQIGTWETAMGGIVSSSTDNKQTTPGYAKKPWRTQRETTVTLTEILDHLHAPAEIDYLSLDIEGAEYDAMAAFRFDKYKFKYLTIERPNDKLRALLRSKGYAYVIDHGCFGDQLWAHESLAPAAARTLGVALSPADHGTCRGGGEVLALSKEQPQASLSLPKAPCDADSLCAGFTYHAVCRETCPGSAAPHVPRGAHG